MNSLGHYIHVPVMVNEVIEYLAPHSGEIIVDATLGGGGHAKALLSDASKINLIGIDRDAEAISAAKDNLKTFGDRVAFAQGNFSDIKRLIGDKKINGILLDLGLSSYQIDTSSRGFSFQADAPLDMRMDPSSSMTAKELINSMDREELENIIRDFGEERYYRRIAAVIMKKRPVSTTSGLADMIKFAIPKTSPINTTKSIARVFQAFRIAVNNELEELKAALRGSLDILATHGRIVVISYHSLEDRIVKDFFRLWASDCICPPRQPVCTCKHRKELNMITKKPVTASEPEIKNNPRARSAKLRAAEKI